MKLLLVPILLTTILSFTSTPQVSIYSPADNSTVSGKVKVIFTAYDPDGLTKFELYVDGELVQTLLPTSREHYLTWNSNPAKSGDHELLVRVYDKLGNVGESAVNVMVEK
jgi:chitinase